MNVGSPPHISINNLIKGHFTEEQLSPSISKDDWTQTPIYELSILKQTPIAAYRKFLRDEQINKYIKPLLPSTDSLLEDAIEMLASETEVEYWIDILNSRDFTLVELEFSHRKALITLTMLYLSINRPIQYDTIREKYSIQGLNYDGLK